MRVAVVDDTHQDVSRLENYIRRYGTETGEKFSVKAYPSGDAFLADGESFDLLIMDIDMPGANGIETARRLRERGNDTVLIFVTNMPQYALDGYQVDAIDYVLKPVDYPDFALKLKKAMRYVQQRREVQLVLNTTGGVVPVSCADILYVESSLHYLTYHLKDADYRARGAMTQAEAELPREQFARCNNSYLVNLRHVKAIEREDVLVEDRRLKMSRGKRLEFLERFTKYLGGMSS